MSQLDMYIQNQDKLVEKYNGQIIAVKDGECLGVFPSLLDGYRAMKAQGLNDGEFMVIKCTPGDKEYTVRIHTPFWLMPGNSWLSR